MGDSTVVKVVILFGAGASHLDGGPGRPPLGDAGLFRELRSHYIDSWGLVPFELENEFGDNFEDGMEVVFEKGIGSLVELHKDMAVFFSRFTVPNEPYHLLVDHYRTAIRSEEILLASLNYDCLLELAAGGCGLSTTYFQSSNGIRFLKLHGSCNFIIDESMIKIGGKLTTGPRAHFESGIMAVHPSEVSGILSRSKFPPAMALYARGKPILTGSKQITELQKQYREAVSQTRAVLVIWAKPNPSDEHVWGPLKELDGTLAYIGNKAKYEEWMSIDRAGKDSVWLGNRFQDSLSSIFGFIDAYLRF